MLPWLLDSQTGRQPAAGLKQLHKSDCIWPYTSSTPPKKPCKSLPSTSKKQWISLSTTPATAIVSRQGKGSANNDTEPMLNLNALALASGTVRPCNPGINDQPELADQDTTETGAQILLW